jgi:hypothetical protein
MKENSLIFLNFFYSYMYLDAMKDPKDNTEVKISLPPFVVAYTVYGEKFFMLRTIFFSRSELPYLCLSW